MIAAILAMAQSPAPDNVRLRTILSNDVVVLAERVQSRTTSVQLWISASETWERYDNHGARHLLEHLMAVGADGNVDAPLEAEGGFLRAETYRDAMSFKVTVPKGKLPLALSALQNVLSRREFTEEEIARESRVLGEEFRLRNTLQKQSAYLWQKQFGEHGLDPFGNLNTIAATTPDDLKRIRTVMVDRARMAIAIVGDEDIDDATAAALKAFGMLPKRAQIVPRGEKREANYPNPLPSGEAFAVPVGSFRDVDTISAIAAGLALASEVPGASFTYTPSNEPSLVSIGTSSSGRLSKAVAAANAEALFGRGQSLTQIWLRRKLADPESIADFRGRLLAQSPSLRPEALTENLPTLTLERFRTALEAFKAGEMK